MIETWRPSPEELELLSTSDESIQKRHETFSFDYEEFTKRLQIGDYWQKLIQAHLYFEHVIAQILSEGLVKPEAISLSRMGFSQRLDLIEALGLLPDELVKPIRKMSKLRNKVAHNLTFEITDSDVRDLENCTPLRLRDAIRATVGRKSGPLELHELLSVILLQIDIMRQHHATSRQISKKAELRLRTVLRKTPNVKYVP